MRHRAAWILLLALGAGCARSEQRWAEDLGSPDPFVRALAALALAGEAPERGAEVAPVLLETVDRPELELQEPSRAALERVAPFALEALVGELVLDPFLTLERRAAIERALLAVGPPAAETLLAAARGVGVVRAEPLAPVLLALGPAARGALQEAARDGARPELAAWAARLLARIEGTR